MVEVEPPRPGPEGIIATSISIAAASPSRARLGVLGFLLALSFLTYFDRVCLVRVQGEIQADLGISAGWFGVVLGAFWLAYALFEVPGGWLGERFGSRRTLTRIVLAWSACTILTGCATGFRSLLAYRFLFGVGEAGAYPNMARVQAAWFPPEARARAGGWLWLAARWGGAFAPALFGALIRLVEDPATRRVVPGLAGVPGWRVGFVVAGVVGLIWAGLFRWRFRDDPATHPGVNAAELALIRSGREAKGRDEAGHVVSAAVWRALMTSRSLWALTGLYFLGNFGWSFFVSWMPRYLEEAHGVRFAASEGVWKQPLFYGGISCLVGGLLSDRLVRATGWRRLGRAAFPVIGLTTAAAAMFSARLVGRPEQAIVLVCLAGAAYDFGQAANWATIVDVGGRHAGIAMGFVNMLSNVSNAVQPSVGAWVFGRFGWDALLAVYAGAFLLAAMMWLFIDPRRPFHAEAEAP